MRQGLVVEAEDHAKDHKVVVSPKPSADNPNRFDASVNNASTASGRACVEPGTGELTFQFKVKKTNQYALAVRYCLERRMHPLWPQDSTSPTPWTDNFSDVEVRLDGELMAGQSGLVPSGQNPHPTTRLYPTGLYNGHQGDVEMWTWHVLNSGKLVQLDAGEHEISIRFKTGLAQPVYDALLISKTSGPLPQHPRWVDQYRIPPAWWVADKVTSFQGGLRRDTYTVTLRNRCIEPCSYEIIADNEKLPDQRVRTSLSQIALKPFEEKSFQVIFTADSSLKNNSGWANIYLWNDDVSLRQKYRLWNLIATDQAQQTKHPVLVKPPDAKLQMALRQWNQQRDPETWTPQLQKWVSQRNVGISEGASAVRGFPSSLTEERLAALDTWMAMSNQEIEEYLPDGPAEYNGYGSGWERMGVEYSGMWYKAPRVTTLFPDGDIDKVTSLTVEGPPQQGKTEVYTKTYTAKNDIDMICAMRDTRWKSMMGHDISGAAPYGKTPLGHIRHTGITLLAEAYYLTGDPAYANKAFEMMRIFSRKYTALTKHFNFELKREDRDWWGGRIGGRYLSKFGPRYYHAMGVYVLDLIWHALTPAQRTSIEHNVLRWGMSDGMSGPLFEVPEYFAAVNREDMPYLVLGRLLGDPAPVQGLKFFYDIYKDIVLSDGIHQCSIGSYGGVGSYITFMQKLNQYGLDVSDNRALRKSFSAHPSFIFSGGGLPNIDDGGGVGLNGLGAGFACPSPEQYTWGQQLFHEPALDVWPELIAAAGRVANSKPEAKARQMRKEYLESSLPVDELWPNLYIAPVKGLAMLRNKQADQPIDWKEVIVDYGLFGGRAHGQPAKLATIPSFNGQIVSMEYGYGMHGNPIAEGFHMRSYAHNVVVVDGKDQFAASGAVPVGKLRGSYSGPEIQWIDTESTKIYANIYMRRTVFTTDFGIVDLYLYRSDQTHRYDWMFHSFGIAKSTGCQPVAKLADTGPLAFAVNPQWRTVNQTIKVTWENTPISQPPTKGSTALLDEKAFVRVWGLPAQDTTISLFGIPMIENVGSEIDYMMLSRTDSTTVFATVQEAWRESTDSPIAAVKRLPVLSNGNPVADNQAYALEIKRHNGEQTIFFVNYTPTAKTIGTITSADDVAVWNVRQNN